jgi:Ca-activated chloride channel family protein
MFSAKSLLALLCGVTLTSVSFGIGAVTAACAQEPQVSIVSRPSRANHILTKTSAALRVDVKLVPIPVTVSDALGRPVSGLTSGDFRVFEDNVEQKIVSLTTEDAPISLGIVFDTSASMNKKLEGSVAAVEHFLKTNVPADEYLLLRFSDRPELMTSFTNDVSEISTWLHSFRASGWTALYDAIYIGVHRMRNAKNPRKALLVLSDGGDNRSRYTATETKRLVEESDVRIYSVSLMETSRVLQQLCNHTGGAMVRVHQMRDLPEAMDKVSRELRSYYVLYYHSTNAQKDGKYRKVRLQVQQPQVRASWRHGYHAPE